MADHAKILLLGKTGVGKSSFINYFLGQTVAKTGIGEPVTLDYFVPYIYTGGRYPVEVVDTRGIEALGASRQKEEIIRAIQERNNSENVYDWFHTIFYCVSLDKPRFEDFEAQFIRDLRRDLSQHIHVIITHCDNKPAEKKISMQREIRNKLPDLENLEIFEVTSVEKRKRSGSVHPHGREEISRRVFQLLISDIADRLANEYAAYLHGVQQQTVRRNFGSFRKFLDKEVNIFSMLTNMDELDRKFEKVSREMDESIASATRDANHRLERVLRPASTLYHTYWSTVHSEEQLPGHVEQELAQLYDGYAEFGMDDDELMACLMPNIGPHMDDDPDLMSLWDMLGNLFKGIWDLLTFKQNAKKAVDLMERRYLEQLPTEEEIRSRASSSIVSFIEKGTPACASAS